MRGRPRRRPRARRPRRRAARRASRRWRRCSFGHDGHDAVLRTQDDADVATLMAEVSVLLWDPGVPLDHVFDEVGGDAATVVVLASGLPDLRHASRAATLVRPGAGRVPHAARLHPIDSVMAVEPPADVGVLLPVHDLLGVVLPRRPRQPRPTGFGGLRDAVRTGLALPGGEDVL